MPRHLHWHVYLLALAPEQKPPTLPEGKVLRQRGIPGVPDDIICATAEEAKALCEKLQTEGHQVNWGESTDGLDWEHNTPGEL